MSRLLKEFWASGHFFVLSFVLVNITVCFLGFLSLNIVLCSEKDAQMCIYDAYCDTHFGFCCNVDEETSRELARM